MCGSRNINKDTCIERKIVKQEVLPYLVIILQQCCLVIELAKYQKGDMVLHEELTPHHQMWGVALSGGIHCTYLFML